MKPTMDALDEIKNRILEHITPVAIILFGSLASGNVTEDSDIDLLVVWDEKQELSNVKRAIEIRNTIGLVDYALDILTCTTTELQAVISNKNSFTAQIIQEGKIVYGRLH